MLACCSIGTGLGAGLTPYDLETEARRNPIGVDVAQPRLGWKLRSAERGEKQAAYQILVSTKRDNLIPGRAELWNSGRTDSEETAWIRYGGAALQPFRRCWWRVRVWDAAGSVSDWSQPAEWTMGVLDPKNWRGEWIAGPKTGLGSDPLPIFRKEIAVERPLRRALVFVAGVGQHELRINGTKVGDGVMSPAWTNYRSTVLYEAFDVTSMLRPGGNALGALLGNGFYNVAGGRYAKYTGSFGQPRLWVHLHLEFEDGASRDLGSDRSWRVRDGPLTFSCIYGGEDFDARLEPGGWDRPGFDDSQWQRAATVEAPGGVLRAQASPPIRVQQRIAPVRATQPKPGVFVYDLGRNFAGWPAIAVSGPAGARVRLTPGELLDASGLVSQVSSGGPAFFTYTLRGSGRETWSPRFSYYGFRYVQVEGAAPESAARPGTAVIHGLHGEFIHVDARRAGHFRCSNELFNRIHRLIDAAVQSNLQHVLTDCPHREKLGWLEQTYLMGPVLLYGWDLRAWLPKVIRDIREAQTADGLFPDIAPEYVTFEKGFRDSPEWGSAGVMLPWLAWQWYGDRQPLEDSYGAMQRYGAYLDAKSEGSLLSYGLGDWYDIGPGPPGPSQLTPRGITATATYFADLHLLERAARLLGKEADARLFAERAEKARAAFQKAFLDPASYGTSSQTALAMALVAGLAEESTRPALIEKLVADIGRRDNHTSAGDIGYRYAIRALLEAGRSDILYAMASRTDPPSYGAQLKAGATSLTEAWDADPRSSQNHLMLGHLEEWFFAGLAGIRPGAEAPGLRHLMIQPEAVGDLDWVEASWETFRGPVRVSWHFQRELFGLDMDLPPGMTATVVLPTASAEQVREGRSAASHAPGVRLMGAESGHASFEVVSGRYEFRVLRAPSAAP